MINDLLNPWREHFEAEGKLRRVRENAKEHIFNIEYISTRDGVDCIPKGSKYGLIG
jgi:hypothetical protein